MNTDVAIIGGGLSGLALASRLTEKGVDFELFEARNRFGGRIDAYADGAGVFDLGPAWFWPGQPRMEALISSLGLRAFDQFASGDAIVETQDGALHRGAGWMSMAGAMRIEGGMVALVDALVERIPRDKVHLAAPATDLAPGFVTLQDGARVAAKRIICALPPRIAATLGYAPPLRSDQIAALQCIPTWMGGQAKVLAVYDTPFWRTAGLSGDAASQRGPLAEIHDASPRDGQTGALFGFVGLPPKARAGRADEIKSAAVAQLTRLFGQAAAKPASVHLQDWAAMPETATDLDHVPLSHHPAYGLPASLDKVWDGRLHFASSELATGFGGLLEGALERAEQVAQTLVKEVAV